MELLGNLSETAQIAFISSTISVLLTLLVVILKDYCFPYLREKRIIRRKKMIL